MSEVHHKEPSSPIKTPQQLITVVVLAFVVPIAIIVMLSQLVTTGLGKTETASAETEEAIAARLKPAFEPARIDYGRADFGLVGDIEKIDPSLLHKLHGDHYIPIIAPIGTDREGNTYNINADLVAGKIAEVMRAEKLIMLTNIRGLLDKRGELLTGLGAEEVEALMDDGTISGGMLPKMDSVLDAVKAGVPRAHIIDGRIEHAVLLELFTDSGIGTLIERR